jgi:hypothetical protein
MAKDIDQNDCIRDYWLDFPRQDKVRIDGQSILTGADRRRLREGKSVSKLIPNTEYTEYYLPIISYY